MTTSLVLHRASDGSDLNAVLSLSAIKSLSLEQTAALSGLGIRRVSDLLQFKPVHDARLVLLAARGQIAHDLSLADLLSPAGAALAVRDLAGAPTTSLASVPQAMAAILSQDFGVDTVAQLAQFGPFLEAQRFLVSTGDVFREPASAPDELLPQVIGSVESTATYSTFVKENTLRLEGLDLTYDLDREHYVDPRLAGLFPVHGQSPAARTINGVARPSSPEVVLHLGFVSKSTQRWVNTGTSLGEIVFSLALAPGESRNIAILDWTRSQRTGRAEDTTASEKMTNNLFHVRALDECTTVTAGEHQNGGTLIAAGTLATAEAGVASAALVGGLAASVPGAAIGTAIGALVGTATGPADPLVAAAGGAAGAVIGFGIGAAASIGKATLGASNAQLGVLRTDSSGDRKVTTDVHQDIEERISQNASSIRSLRSNIFVSDDQSETQNITGRNITNYNHSHMLNLQYYEVLQRYRAELRLTAAEPLLFLPFRPLDFTLELIADYWSILRTGVSDLQLRRSFDRLVCFGAPEVAQPASEALIETGVVLTRKAPISTGLINFQEVQTPVVSLLVKQDARPVPKVTRIPSLTQFYTLRTKEEPLPFADVDGIQVENLIPNEVILIDISLRLKDDAIGSSRTLSRKNVELQARQDGTIVIPLGQGAPGEPEGPSLEDLRALERFFDARRYFFTRLLLLSIEKEQIIDLVEALMLQNKRVVTLTQPVQLNLNRVKVISFTPRQALPDLVGQNLRKDLEDILAAGLKNPSFRISLNQTQFQQLIQAILDRVKDIISSPAAETRSSTTLSKDVKIEIETILLSARLPKAAVDGISEKAADAFRQRFDGIRKLPGAATPAVHLSEFIEPEPLAITGNTLVFRMKKIQNAPVQQNALAQQHLGALLAHPAAIEAFVAAKKKVVTSQDVFLPTSGVFAEAILGRANGSEKVDATRFINWLDLPIPNAAPRIADLQLQNLRGEPLETDVTVPGNVLNIVNPPAFPDTTARDALNALNNGNLFRDMSRSDVLAGVLNNLSSLANNQSQLAGNLAGQAQQEALRQAAAIANKVADLTAQFAQNTPSAPATDTAKAGLLNQVLKLLGEAGVNPGGLPGAGAAPGNGSVPGGNGGSAGGQPANSGSAPAGNPAAPNLFDEVKSALGGSTPAVPSAPAVPVPPVEAEKFKYTFKVRFEDFNGKTISPDFLLINPQAGGASESKVMGPPEIDFPINVRDQSGSLRAITPNLEVDLELPKNSQGKVVISAALVGAVNLAGEAPLRLGVNNDRFVTLLVGLKPQRISVDAADAADAIQIALALAEPADGSASPLKLGSLAKEMKDFFKVEPGASAGKFVVLVPDIELDVKQLDR